MVWRLTDPVQEDAFFRISVDVARSRQCIADKRSMFRQNHVVNTVLSPVQTYRRVHQHKHRQHSTYAVVVIHSILLIRHLNCHWLIKPT